MTKTPNDGKRLPWTTPQLRRIQAGSAEALNSGSLDDGATKGNSKS